MFLITEFKRCRCCQETLPASSFSFNRQRLGLHSYCNNCQSEKHAAEHLRHRGARLTKQKEYREAHKTQSREYYEANAPAIKARASAFYEVNREETLMRRKTYYAEHKEEAREYATVNRQAIRNRMREYAKIRSKTDPRFKIIKNLYGRVYAALKGTVRSKKTMDLLGCSIDFLRAYLEKQFVPGMTWENYGPVWHVDHIKPCARFSDLSDPLQQKQCFNYTNLQPLFAFENISKGARVPGN